MNTLYRTTLSLLFCTLAAAASAQRIVTVDGTLTTDTAKAQFADIRDALGFVERHWSADTLTEVRIMPGVYWIDDPDDPTIRRPRKGSNTPFGMEVTMSNVRLAGMGDKPEDVVLASQRGQTQGADGNFTMLHITGNDITARNITFGNYCNVDLIYPRDERLNRRRKADAIVQAQLVICRGDRYLIDHCRFISRLNLCPFVGADHVLFRNCYFESTDDALCGTGVYVGCRFTFFSSKPFYISSRQGAVFYDCDIHSKVHGTQYLSKVGSPFFIIDTRFTSDDPQLRLDWTSLPGEMLRCYASGVTLNGKPATIGHSPNTVDMTPLPLLAEWRGKLSLLAKTTTPTDLLKSLPSPLYLDKAEQHIEADVEETTHRYITTRTMDGREAAVHLTIEPSLLPPPEVVRPLRLKRKGKVVTAYYELALNGHKDQSDLLWYRVKDGDSILVQVDGQTYELTDADKGYEISCRLEAKSNRSTREAKRHLCDYRQERVIDGFWTFDTFKPADTADFDWTPDSRSSGWTWGRGVDGAADSEGFIQTAKGARMMYTPVSNEADMTVTVECDPCKSAGQGFGSATGQYMDIAIKMDNHTLTGYALRLRRTPYLDHAVEAVLMEYDNGRTHELCKPAVTEKFKKGCVITVGCRDNVLTADICGERLLTAKVAPSPYAGFMIQHTGSVGASATVVKAITFQNADSPCTSAMPHPIGNHAR